MTKEVHQYEKLIEQLESKKSKIESELSDELVYSNPQLSAEKNKDYDEIKKKLDETFHIWSEKSEKLEYLFQQFENALK